MRLMLAAHVMDQRAAASFAWRRHHLDAVAVQDPDRRRVDIAAQHPVGTALQQRDPALALAFGRVDAALRALRRHRSGGGRQPQHGSERLEA